MSIRELSSPIRGLAGYLHEIEIVPDKVLIFQLPRATKMLSRDYINGTMASVKHLMPPDVPVMFMGADVNIYEIDGIDAVTLKLKGLISDQGLIE